MGQPGLELVPIWDVGFAATVYHAALKIVGFFYSLVLLNIFLLSY